MRKIPSGPAAGFRPLLIGFALGIVAAVALLVPAASAEAQAPQTRIFNSGAALVIFNIKPDRTKDFEMIMERTKQALMASEKPERRRQAANWKVFRAVEAGPQGAVTYIVIMDPAVKDADYNIVNILNEAFPTEIQDLFKAYSEAFASGMVPINLSLVADFAR